VIFWRPKSGKVLTRRRAIHLAIGLVAPWVGFRLGGYEALGWACWGMLIVAGAWEVSTPGLAPVFGWLHRRGDVVDLAFFSSGVSACGLILGAACRPT
jgi:hypothetical protein